jgi:hypothetical protein
MIKKLSRRTAVVAGAVALAFAATAGTAYADVYHTTGTLPSQCWGDLDLGSGNYGWGDVYSGISDCTISIYSENTSTGGTKLVQSFTIGPSAEASTTEVYYDSGVHKLMVMVDDGKWSSSTGYHNSRG